MSEARKIEALQTNRRDSNEAARISPGPSVPPQPIETRANSYDQKSRMGFSQMMQEWRSLRWGANAKHNNKNSTTIG